jgi:cell wall-associated NlpC family hydrolase
MSPITPTAPAATPTYYDTPEKIAALLAAATRWRGTPFRENSAVPGPRGGVCCHMLVAHLYIETGALDPFDIPRGSARRLLHNPADTMLAYIDTALAGRIAVPAPPEPALAGDMIVYRDGATAKHIAIVLPGLEPAHGPRLIHVLRHSGAAYSEFNDPTYAHNIVTTRRPLPRAVASR